jgi:hypothetical protein
VLCVVSGRFELAQKFLCLAMIAVEIKCEQQPMEFEMNKENKQNIVPEGQNTPQKAFRVGPVKATVWKNIGQNDKGSVEYLSVSFERSYLDAKTNTWKYTASLRANDLPKAVLALNKAYEYIVFSSKQESALEGN